MSQDRCSTSPPPPPPSAMAMRPDIHHTPPQPRNQEDWLSEFRLDSPPRVEFITLPEEPHSPTSPPGSPPSIGNPTVEEPLSPTSPPGSPPSIGNPTVSPKHTSFESDPECRSLDAEEDPYFKSLVDNFIAAADLGKPTLLDDIDMKAIGLRKSNLYAESALKYYNNDEENKLEFENIEDTINEQNTFVNIIMHQQKLNATIDTAKYELIRVITFYEMLDDNGCYGHVNFVAKGDQQNSDEELFFAELRWDYGTVVPTCVLSLEGEKRIVDFVALYMANSNSVGRAWLWIVSIVMAAGLIFSTQKMANSMRPVMLQWAVTIMRTCLGKGDGVGYKSE
ncbi:hypothetical protein ACP70R_029561 [Stipagrostis hirtigluma subsp. patula]